jgi:tetratricopeptide (TPR) repeat protein
LLIVAWILTRYLDDSAMNAPVLPERRSSSAPQGRRYGTILTVMGVVLVFVAGEFYLTRDYLDYWHNTRSLRQHMVDVTPWAPTPNASLGSFLAEAGEWDDAIAHLNTALTIEPNNAHIHYNLANALAGRGDNAGAIEHFQTALTLDHNLSQAHNNLARLFVLSGRSADAIPHYREATKLKPESVTAHYNLGLALVDVGQAEEAIKEFHTVLDLDPRNADAHCNIGMLLSRQGKRSEALQEFEAALRIDPHHARTIAAMNKLSTQPTS